MRIVGAASLAAVLFATSASAQSLPHYKWALTNPTQLAAYRTKTAIVTVAEVHTTNGCQTGFIVPTRRMKFAYQIEIRTTTGPILCTQVDRHVLVSFLEYGDTQSVHATTSSGTENVTVVNPPTSAPAP